MSEIIDISPSNLDSSLCFIQPEILCDILFPGEVKSLSCVHLFATLWMIAYQAPPSM